MNVKMTAPLTSVFIITSRVIILLIISVNGHRINQLFPYPSQRMSLKVIIYISCWSPVCVIKINIPDEEDLELKYEDTTELKFNPRKLSHFKDGGHLLETKGNATFLIGRTDAVTFLNIYPIFPTVKTDCFFVLTLLEETKFIEVLAVHAKTSLTLAYTRRPTDVKIQQKATIAERYRNYYFSEPDASLIGGILRTDKEVSVFFGKINVDDSLRSFASWGRKFIVPVTDFALVQNITAFCYRESFEIIWYDEFQDERFEIITPSVFRTGYKTISVNNDNFYVYSKYPMAVIATFRGKSTGNFARISLPPMRTWLNKYKLRVPYSEHKDSKTKTRKLAVIARIVDFENITVNKVNIRSWMSNPITVKGLPTYAMGTINHSVPLLLEYTNDTVETVPFCVFLYGEEAKSGFYLNKAGMAYDKKAEIEPDNGTSLLGDDDVHSLKLWELLNEVLMTIFVPLGVILLVLGLVWLSRKLRVSRDDQIQYQEREEISDETSGSKDKLNLAL